MLNRRSLLLYYRVNAKAGKRRIRLRAYFAIYVLNQLLLSMEGIAGLVPGNPGRYVRILLNAIQGLIYGIMQLEPQKLLEIDAKAEGNPVHVEARTIGF